MNSDIVAAIEQLPGAQDLPLPAYATDGAAGVDLLAAVEAEAGIELAPGRRALVPTGIRIALPRGYEGQIRPRSGLALRHGVTVLNAPGTIDSDYRGEIGVVLANCGEDPFPIARGMRIAQLVIAPVVRISWRRQKVAAGATGRGARGFGSTGLAGGVSADSHRRD